MKDLVSRIVWRTGLTELASRVLVRKKRFVLMFHGVSRHRRRELPPHVQPYFSIDELRSALAWVGARFSFLTPEQFLNSSDSGVLLTFDDGLANNVVNALPVLESFRAPAIFFVTTQHVIKPNHWLPAVQEVVERYWGSQQQVPKEISSDFFDGMDEKQLAFCASHPLITIGGHTIAHPFLSKISTTELNVELSDSKAYLEAVSGKEVTLFAYPTGDYNVQVMEEVKAVGYRAAFAVDSNHIGWENYEIPRVGLYDSQPHYLSAKLSGIFRGAQKPFGEAA